MISNIVYIINDNLLLFFSYTFYEKVITLKIFLYRDLLIFAKKNKFIKLKNFKNQKFEKVRKHELLIIFHAWKDNIYLKSKKDFK